MEHLEPEDRLPSPSRGAWIFWGCGLASILLCHLVLAWFNDAPPIWDMAYHEAQGWRFLEAWREGRLWENIASLSPVYPPWFYLQEALWIALLGASGLLGVAANLGAVVLLSFSTWRLGRLWLSEREAVAASLIVLLFPEVAWMSRETILDVWLAAWVSLAGFWMVKSRHFERFGATLVFALAVAGGVLTKWTCPLYLAIPAAWWWWMGPRRWRAAGRLTAAAALTVPLVLPYYLPNLSDFLARYPTTEQAGLIPWRPYPRHGEPGLNNIWGWIYYPRVLAGYFLQLPLLFLGVWGWVSGGRTRARDMEQLVATFLWVWLLGGMAALTLLSPKDPRFALPLAAPLAILLAGVWRRRPAGQAAVLSAALMGFLLVTVPTPLGRFKLALGERRPDPDFQGLQREWALLQTDYFNLVGPPRREDWAYAEILREIPDGAMVAFLPELPRFHAEGLQLQAIRRGRRIDVRRLGQSAGWERRLPEFDYLVAKTGPQGLSFTTRYNHEIMQALSAGGRPPAAKPLPDGTVAQIWKP